MHFFPFPPPWLQDRALLVPQDPTCIAKLRPRVGTQTQKDSWERGTESNREEGQQPTGLQGGENPNQTNTDILRRETTGEKHTKPLQMERTGKNYTDGKEKDGGVGQKGFCQTEEEVLKKSTLLRWEGGSRNDAETMGKAQNWSQVHTAVVCGSVIRDKMNQIALELRNLTYSWGLSCSVGTHLWFSHT